MLRHSRFLTWVILVVKADLGFCDGASHQRRYRYRNSSFDTAVFWLQNASGALTWPVSEEAVQD